MANIHTSLVSVTTLKQQLAGLAARLNAAYQGGDIQTIEALSVEATTLLGKLSKGLGLKALFSPGKRLRNSSPDSIEQNLDLQSIDEDLRIIFGQFSNIEGVALNNWNFLVSDANRLRKRVQALYSRVNDYALYAGDPIGDGIFFHDSFSDLSKIDNNSRLLAQEQCGIETVEGLLTLPIDLGTNATVSSVKDPIIETSSNGFIGNNHEIGAEFHGDISVVIDSNPDTWFEYERVISTVDDTGEPLLLEITIPFSRTEILNFIRVNPNNFGTRTITEIVSIDTSEDGETYFSIKDDQAFSHLSPEQLIKAFSLAPNMSKFAGQGFFSFTPRRTKFVRILLKQETPYTIETTSGTKLRYAIGIRDILLESRVYKNIGEAISLRFDSSDAIKKLLLETIQLPDEETPLAQIKHFISFNDGASWQEIQSKGFSGKAGVQSEVPEIINLNTSDTGAFTTQAPVYSLRYKAVLQRFDEAFIDENAANLQHTRKTVTELIKAPIDSTGSLQLSSSPIDGTIQVLDPRMGSRGRRHHTLELSEGAAGASERFLTLDLPFEDIPLEITKSGTTVVRTNPVEVRVDGKLWARGNVTTPASSRYVYELDLKRGQVRFGEGVPSSGSNGITPRGKISIQLSEEHLYPNQHGEVYLKFPTPADKEQFELYIVRPERSATTVLQQGAQVHRLNGYITSGSLVFSDTGVFVQGETSQEKTFIDGTVELDDDPVGQWSVDYENGIVYSYSNTSDSSNTTVRYSYSPRTQLSDTDYDFIRDDDGVVIGIKIKQDLLESFDILDETLTSSKKRISLSKTGIIPGSLRFTGGSGTHFVQEVPFINGSTEFSTTVSTTFRLPNITGGSPQQINLSPPVSSTSNLVFSNSSLFEANPESTAGQVNTNGEWHLNTTTSVLTVFLTSDNSDPGTVSYFFDSPIQTTSNLAGKYSVDYQSGIIYTPTVIPSNWKASYKYTDYRARYNIARKITNFSVNLEEKRIYLSSDELIKSRKMHGIGADSEKQYLVTYDTLAERQVNISELAKYFSPYLYDYKVRAITASRVIE